MPAGGVPCPSEKGRLQSPTINHFDGSDSTPLPSQLLYHQTTILRGTFGRSQSRRDLKHYTSA